VPASDGSDAVRRPAPLCVLDDDPTGTQAVHDVPVLLRWSSEDFVAVRDAAPAVYVLTNTRALAPADAEETTRAAAAAARAALPGCDVLLRGDSTLRGHVLEEYRGIRDALHGGDEAALLLVPALPAAGRVTRDGIHWIVRDGRRVPLDETEYARDPDFAYSSARLVDWAHERTKGHVVAARGVEVQLARVRSAEGADVVADALLTAAARAPAACVPDAETDDDLAVIAEGLRRARARGARVVVRSAPTFAAVLAGRRAHSRVSPPDGRGGVLVVCGSYVPTTTRQLEQLLARRKLEPVVVDVHALASDAPEAEIARAAVPAARAIAASGASEASAWTSTTTGASLRRASSCSSWRVVVGT